MPDQVVRTRAAAHDVGEAARLLEDVYGAPMDVRSEPRRFRFRADAVNDGALGLARIHYTGSGATSVEASANYIVAMVVAGDLSWRIGTETGGGAFLLLPGRGIDAEWSELGLASLTLGEEVVARAAAASTGREETRGTPRTAPSGADLHYIRGVMQHLHATIRQVPDILDSPLVREAMTQSAAHALIASFPTLVGEIDARTSAPRTVRRAAAFLDDHLGDPVTVADAARAAGISLRALEAGFRQHLDRTPSEYLRRARLAAARAELEAADPTEATVAAIARRWGFGHLSRFAQDFRREFGETPSTMLRR